MAVEPPVSAAACVTIPVVAHRGGLERWAENSGNAYRDASNQGAGVWETDVRFTSDDVPVIMHDPEVDRTTDGTGLVADLTYAQVAALRTADGQPVPTLTQLINDAAVDGPRLLVELKTVPTPAQWATFNAALASRPGVASRVLLMSFEVQALVGATQYAPALTRGLLQSVGDTDPAAVTPYAKILIKHVNAITAARMTKWKGAGLTVYAWTVNTSSEWERMTWYPGMAGVITDQPGAYLAWQKSRTC
ncbi:glycerophosphoryl diester phosphodiesterase [Actinoplanes italicus]|uniref:Glycerophosphoryl diester phosphodiesterase n=1 Tax=Actinoplanes italicus TaxID=113567 RepID=A0A2T0KDY5_9ACTN|nr:glycerophosphodiester phosphodiesterase family protein [Actinoplanes italicus]PRX21434.1 glycerophosphoryl diester phosphodiesterase [Actinoplanes italicus]GIE27114.1 glycerophosphoryl diester phosphodiesterase [Actinoplanes italicus]